jgi:hypothetical protein
MDGNKIDLKETGYETEAGFIWLWRRIVSFTGPEIRIPTSRSSSVTTSYAVNCLLL